MRPESRGDVSLRSSTPSDAPRIRPNYLSAERDQAMAVTICHWARRIAAQSPLAELIEAESFPGQIIRSDDEILNWARRSGGSVYHPSVHAEWGQMRDRWSMLVSGCVA